MHPAASKIPFLRKGFQLRKWPDPEEDGRITKEDCRGCKKNLATCSEFCSKTRNQIEHNSSSSFRFAKMSEKRKNVFLETKRLSRDWWTVKMTTAMLTTSTSVEHEPIWTCGQIQRSIPKKAWCRLRLCWVILYPKRWCVALQEWPSVKC